MGAHLASEAIKLVKIGRAEHAIAMLERTPASSRRSEEVVRAYALALAHVSRITDAIQALQTFLYSESTTPQTRALAARLYEDAGRATEAYVQYSQLVRKIPSQTAFWRGLLRSAISTKENENAREALALAEQLRCRLNSDAALTSLALHVYRKVCESQHDIESALAFAENAVSRFPEDGEIRSLVARFVIDARPIEALDWLGRRSAFAPTTIDETGMTAALALPQLIADENAINDWRTRYAEGLKQFEALTRAKPSTALSLIKFTPFALAYQGRNDLELQTMRGEALALAAASVTPTPVRTRALNDERIRVGFVSKHLRDCTVGRYFSSFMTGLPDHCLDVYTYACGAFDAYTDQIERHSAAARRFPISDGEDHDLSVRARITQTIFEDQIDVLIYPEIGMEPLIEKLAATRLAPLQCALWGHPVTTGLPTIDVYFSVRSMEPPNFADHYREQVVLLPGLGCSYPAPPEPENVGREQLGLPLDSALLICAQSSFKWNSAFVDTVATILLKHANAKLVYFRNRDVLAALAFEQFLEQRLIARGLSPRERVIAMSETSRERFLAILAACDLALDTFGFSGGNTTLDSLSVGLPVVTLPGDFMRGRQSMAMLEMLDVSALVAKDSDDYVRIVLDLLSRANMRVGLRARLLASAPSLFDDYTPIDALRNWLLTYAREHKFDQSTSHPSLPNDASGNRSTKLYRSGQTVDRC